MKKFILIAGLFISFSSCEVLDVKPQSAVPADEAINDKAGVEKGVLGAYNGLQSLSYYGRTYCIFADLAADNLLHPANATAVSYDQVDNNAILPENESVDGIWGAIYDAINVANNVIDKVPGISDMSAAEKNSALGELYFLRALNHFNLMNYFGRIPVKTKPTVGLGAVNAARDEINVVYDQIISDLQFASQNLAANSSLKTRATKQAANALLARVYLYRQDYVNAGLYASQVINAGGYSLMTDYAEIFSSEGISESIFEVDFTELDRNRIAEYNFPLSLNGRREVAPDPTLLAAYTTSDTRLNASVGYSGTDAYAKKYDDLSTGSDNFMVLRLAEMYLIRAEAIAMLNGNAQQVQDDINVIRNRAGLADVTTSDITQLIPVIETERRLELAFEGHRWFDLVRTGRATVILPTVTNINKTLFPIPLSELLSNTSPGMTQNPGY
ncbi:MAG: RagB/SusD family nutrient uptake outer membrane protein [Bacteroidota bacterium]